MRTGNPTGIKALGTQEGFFSPEDAAGDCWQQLWEEN